MTEKVLLVDDEEDFARVLARRMEVRGLRVSVASSGAEALEKIEREQFDAIILDLVMPVMDGLETLRKIREKKPYLQVILLTGRASVEKGMEAIRLGAMDILEKPADLARLLATITEAKAKMMVLIEEKSQQKVADILRTKGW